MQMVEEEVNNIDMMGLSAREMEIIDLVADGLTNQEIAVKLTISKRTVDIQMKLPHRSILHLHPSKHKEWLERRLMFQMH